MSAMCTQRAWPSASHIWWDCRAMTCLSDDLPNNWVCFKFGHDGKPDQVKPRHTRGRMSKDPQDGKSECEYMPCLESATSVTGNPALNFTLKPYEVSGELFTSELDPCDAPPKKKASKCF
ncbi:hypothetical protein MRX96_015897 [Rhipicephalus microplus]